MKTRVTELLGIKYPIILGGLQGLGRARLAAAVSEAGGLGLVTAGCFESLEELADEIALARSLTGKPVGVNISIGSRRSMDEYVDCVCHMGVPIVFTSGNSPEKYVAQLKRHHITWVHVSSAVRYAAKCERLGADAVVLVGFEAGGHPGLDEVALSVLLRKAVDTLRIPVIAAGAISDARSVVAAFALGAEGVQMGTRFVLTQESILHDRVKQALLAAGEGDTLIIERTMRKSRRVLRTSQAEKILAMEWQGATFEQLKPIVGGEAYLETILQGRMDRGVVSTGQCVGTIDDVPTVAELIREMVEGIPLVVSRLNGILDPLVRGGSSHPANSLAAGAFQFD